MNFLILTIFFYFSSVISVNACSVCFSNVSNDPSINALKWSILTLLLITIFVLSFFVKFIFRLRRYEKITLNSLENK